MSKMTVKATLQFALRYWAQLDCPTSLKLAIMAEAGDWAGVLSAKVKPADFIDPFEYGKANAAVCLLKKNPDVPGSSTDDRRSAALKVWRAGEAQCYHANERLSPFLVSPLSGDPQSEFLRRVRKRLLDWLGRCPEDDELKTRARHGPGTTFRSSVPSPTAADKYTEKMTLTRGSFIHTLNLAGTKWMQIHSDAYPRDWYEVIPGNRFTTVSKTALIDRSIGIEGSLNVYFQLAVGSAIRSRMRKRAGWDLDNAASLHKSVAKSSSLDSRFCTLDLSNASDTLCKNLVRILLRDSGWLPLLEDLRSSKTQVDDQWHLLEKFSSMGNGYTFELESCIFAALCAECLCLKGIQPKLGENLFVFGDDIIVPTECGELVAQVLGWTGFVLNEEKSFFTGSFRESCGGDFFDGIPVRGFYLKAGLTKTNHQLLFTVHNGIKRLFEDIGCDCLNLLEYVIGLLPPRLRNIYGPARLGDTVLLGESKKWKWVDCIKWSKAVQWTSPITISWKYFSPDARLACRLTGYGGAFGIDSRGATPCSELIWVSIS